MSTKYTISCTNRARIRRPFLRAKEDGDNQPTRIAIWKTIACNVRRHLIFDHRIERCTRRLGALLVQRIVGARLQAFVRAQCLEEPGPIVAHEPAWLVCMCITRRSLAHRRAQGGTCCEMSGETVVGFVRVESLGLDLGARRAQVCRAETWSGSVRNSKRRLLPRQCGSLANLIFIQGFCGFGSPSCALQISVK
jgi:hypothetical protein